MVYFVAGLIVGVFIPAPYDSIAKTAIRNAWDAVRSIF